MDIDLLLFGEEVIDGQDFQVPHRGISRMRDLAEVAARGDVLVVALSRREMVGAE